MKIRNGYVWSERQQRWRKLPRKVWRMLQAQRLAKIEQKKKDKQKYERNPL